ncbi:Rieske (2Fe-2S) protein [Streptomyces sp. Pv4-95]|uniref:Rieske (2Fe-2S) protein n=1 Tax=Streptomyces sp. Pv4-95 TaxID=3049543 RepID=UPI003891DC96
MVGTGQGARRGTARRAVVAAVGAAGLTAALAACGGGTQQTGTQPEVPAAGGAEDSGQDTPPDNGGADDGAAGESDGGTAGGGSELAKTADIPKGGGKIFKAEKVVVTQPQDGEFKAFSAVCTHSGCLVGEISGGTINCMCHGSKFDITDGSVKDGPAPRGLPAAKVNVDGGSVTLG